MGNNEGQEPTEPSDLQVKATKAMQLMEDAEATSLYLQELRRGAQYEQRFGLVDAINLVLGEIHEVLESAQSDEPDNNPEGEGSDPTASVSTDPNQASTARPPIPGDRGKLTPEEVAEIQAKVQKAIDDNRRLKALEVIIPFVRGDIESVDALERIGPAVSAQKTALQLYLGYLIREQDALKAQQAADRNRDQAQEADATVQEDES